MNTRAHHDISPALASVVRDLDAHGDRALAPGDVAHALRHPVTLDDVAAYVNFSPENYVRRLVAKNLRWELRLMSWRPGQSTSLHGHDGAACAFRIVRGSAIETVLGEHDRVWPAGSVVQEPASGRIHQVGNALKEPLITLHAYSPALPVDRPSPRTGRQVVVVGGGFSGVAAAFHLLRRGGDDLRVTIVERRASLGRGIAYGVDSPTFRLNVPASKMSIDPDVPDDFVVWSGAQRENAFLERARYGDYVVDRLGRAIIGSRGKLRLLRAEATAADAHEVRTATGDVVAADAVILATGLATRDTKAALPPDARIIDAWDDCGLATLPPDGRILILGAGLSALDVVAILKMRRFRGEVLILSRNGLLPRPHLEPFTPGRPLPATVAASAPKTLRALVAWIRTIVERHELDGAPWQHAIDALRPHLPMIWRGLSPRDRKTFVRSIRPFWEVLRHRAPADALDIIEDLRGQGRLEVVAGRIAECVATAGGLDVEIRLRGKSSRRGSFQAIVRCIGPGLGHSETTTPLLRSLIDARIAAPDPAGLGIVTGERGALVSPDGHSSERFFALGVLQRASTWESTSVPDIAAHAKAIASAVLAG